MGVCENFSPRTSRQEDAFALPRSVEPVAIMEANNLYVPIEAALYTFQLAPKGLGNFPYQWHFLTVILASAGSGQQFKML